MRLLAYLAVLSLVAPACLAGGVITYDAHPPITAGIVLNRDWTLPGGHVDARLTNGPDPYGFPSDRDELFVDGNPTQIYFQDTIERVVWSVSVGTLGDSGASSLESTSIADRFHVVWRIPVGTPAGVYSITANVYDAGLMGASSRDSVDPDPVSRSATMYVGRITYSAAPPIAFDISAEPASPAPGQTVNLKARESGQPEAVDQDSVFLDGVFLRYEPDNVESVKWQVTDRNGVSAGTLSGGTFTNEWTAPSEPGTYYVTVTMDDRAAGGRAVDDDPVTKTLAVGVGQSAGTTVRTQAQAIALARAIGQPETGTATARFPVPAPYEGAGATYFMPRWRVAFSNGTEVEVVDNAVASQVAHYLNPGILNEMEGSGDPAGPAISESQALSAVAALLSAAGQTTDLGPSDATLRQITAPPTKAGQTWTIVRQREFSDPPYAAAVPYRDQQATVILQGETGQVIGYGLTFPTEEPASAGGHVTSTQADATATALLAARKITGYTSETPVKMVVRPNTAWQENGSTDSLPVLPRVAWVCSYSDDTALYEVWIAVDTGEVLGGEIARVRSRRTPPWR